MKRFLTSMIVALIATIALSSTIATNLNSCNFSNNPSGSEDLNKIIELIKSNYKNPNSSKLYNANPGEKVYKFEEKENVAFQGRACWKTNVQILVFVDDDMGVMDYMKIDLIDQYGGYGRNVYKKGPESKEMKFILVNDVIYKWTKEDYSDLEEFLIYDGENDLLKSKDNKKIYKAEINRY